MNKLLIALASACVAGGVFANVVITDAVPAQKDVSVSANEELEVRGNGLTSACTLTLDVGATVKFYTSATIAATVTSQGSVHFTTASSDIVGTISGSYTAKAPADATTIHMDAPGLVNFIGGGTIESGRDGLGKQTYSVLEVNGNFQVTNKEFKAYCKEKFLSGHFTVANGGKWKHFGQYAANLNLAVDVQQGDVCYEVGEGGYACYGNNEQIFLGADASRESKLLINGGTFETLSLDKITLNWTGTGKSVLEIDNGGVFKTFRRIFAHNRSGSSVVRLKNGTWDGNNRNNNWATLFAAEDATRSGYKVNVELDGTFKIDLSTFATTSLADTPDIAKVQTSWSATPGSVLWVNGRSAGTSSLTIRGFTEQANGLAFRFNPDDTYKANVILENAPSTLTLGGFVPYAGASTVSAVATEGGSVPVLTARSLVNQDSVIVGTDAGAELPSGFFQGFASVDYEGLAVDGGADGALYLPTRVMRGVDTVRVLTGTLIAATDTGNIVCESGASVSCQDGNDALVLRNQTKFCNVSRDTWTDPATGESVFWTPGANAQVDPVDNNGGIIGRFLMNELIVSPRNVYWDYESGGFDVAEGGVAFAAAAKWSLCSKNFNSDRIRLVENQAWTNLAASGTARLSSIDINNQYKRGRYAATANVTDWRLGERLEVWLSSPDNNFATVTVTVDRASSIRLVKETDGQLHAKKLVLNGSEMCFGQAFPVKDTQGNTWTENTVIDTPHVASEIELCAGGRLSVAAETVYGLPILSARGIGNAVSGTGSLDVTQAVVAVSVPAANDVLSFAVPMKAPKPMSVFGAGTLSVDTTVLGSVPDIAFADGGRLELAGSGNYAGTVTEAGGMSVRSDSKLWFQGSLVGFGGNTIRVTAGTLVLSDKDALPSGVTVTTEGEGALSLLDPTGFDRETQMEGTKNLVGGTGSLVITDVERANETLYVGAGKTLEVYGSGLVSSSRVYLDDGAAIAFYASATIAAPVVTTNAVRISAVSEDVVGTFSGRFTAYGETNYNESVVFGAPGTIRFTGGASFGDDSPHRVQLRVKGAKVEFDGGTYDLKASLAFHQGRVTVMGGAALTWAQNIAQNAINMALAGQTGDVLFEVRTNSTVKIQNNCHIDIGNSTTYESRLYLNGGTFIRDQADRIAMYGKSTLAIDNGGRLSTYRHVEVYGKLARIELGDGSWDFNAAFGPNGYNYGVIYAVQDNAKATVWYHGDFTNDISSTTSSRLAITNAHSGRVSCTVDPGSRLTVVSNPKVAKSLVMNGFTGNGLMLKIATSNVTFAVNAATEPVSLVYDVSSAEGARIAATGTSPALSLGYWVPAEGKLDLGNLPVAVEGFSSTTVSDLTFGENATLVFPYFGTDAPFAVAGTVSLPSALNYEVVRLGALREVESEPVLTAAKGIIGVPAWTCTGGIRSRNAQMVTGAGAILFAYHVPGMALILR